jgi:hypothetical protein
MFKKNLLLLIGILSLIWIFYAAYDLLNGKNSFNPNDIFNKEDGSVLVIHHSNEFDWDQVNFQPQASLKGLIEEILFDLPKDYHIFISKNRAHFLLQTKSTLTLQEINLYFKNKGLDLKPSNNFQLSGNGLTVCFSKNAIYVYKSEDLREKSAIEFSSFDKKASCSLFKLEGNQFIASDYYFSNNEKIKYVNRKLIGKNIRTNQINDYANFASVIPANPDAYHFITYDYLMASDKVFAKSSLAKVSDKGLVVLNYKNEKVLISDIKVDVNANYAFDENNEETSNERIQKIKDRKLCEIFPESKNGYYVYILEDFLVIGKNKRICGQIIADYKTGNTTALNEQSKLAIYGDLPFNVTERIITPKLKQTNTYYNQYLIQTNVYRSSDVSNDEPVKENITLSNASFEIDADLKDVYQFENGNLLICTSKSVGMYEKGNKKWSFDTKNPMPDQTIQTAKLQGKYYFAVHDEKGIYLFDENGKFLSKEYIIVNGNQTIAQIRMGSTNQQLAMSALTIKGQIHVFNQKGIVQNTFSGAILGKNKMAIYVKSGKLQMNYVAQDGVRIVDLGRFREVKSYPVRTDGMLSNTDEYYYAIENNQLQQYNNAGNRISLTRLDKSYKLIETAQREDQTNLFLRSSMDVLWFDVQKNKVVKIKHNTTTDERIEILEKNNKILISMVNPLENNISLFNENGLNFNNFIIEGEQMAKISMNRKGQWVLLTEVDGFIIQYTINEN